MKIGSLLLIALLVCSWPAIAFAGTPLAAPTISAIANQLTQVNTAKGPIAFTVGDTDTNLDSLTVSGVSSNTALIPSGNLVFGGAGSDRTITLTPTTDQTGLSTIIVTVSDGSQSASDTFQIRVNAPPHLDFNAPLTLNEGATATFTSLEIHAIDADGPDTQIIYTIANGSQGTPTTHGVMKLSGTPLDTLSTFTQDDINNNRVTYTHDGSETTADMFTFGVTDGDGGIGSDNGFTSFSFHIVINPVNDVPIAHDAVLNVSLGTPKNGFLSATDPDSPTLTFSIVTNGTRGSAVVTDSATGAYTYTPNPSASGADSVAFQVFDGSAFSAAPGIVRISIANQPPAVANGGRTIQENQAFSDTFHAVDADLPKQTLTFTIVSSGSIGTAVLNNSVDGTFTYTPQHDVFGADTIVFKANDGLLDSPLGFYAVTVRPVPQTGDILVADNHLGALLVINPVTGAQGIISSGDSLKHARDVVVEASGSMVVLDQNAGLVRVDPLSGQQTTLTLGSSFTTGPLGPTSIAIEQSGSILVADGTAGLKRVDPTSGAVSVLSSGSNIHLAVSVAVASNGDIYMGDASAFGGGTSRVLKIDPVSGNQTNVSVGGQILLPVGIAIGDSGQIYVSDVSSFAGGTQDYLYKIDPTSGVQTVIVTSDTLHLPTGLDIDLNGKLIVCNDGGKKIYRVEPATGAVTIVSAAGLFSEPFGIAIMRPLPKITATKSLIAFGAVSVGSNRKDSLVVSNPGDAPLYITSVASDSVQFQVSPSNATIAPSGSTTFYVTFTPTSSDTINSYIRFTHNAGPVSLLSVSGSGLTEGVKEGPTGIPATFALYANFPNPFNPTTTLQFDIPTRSVVTVKIYTVIGTVASTPVDHREYEPGTYRQRFDASSLSSGVYFYEITAGPHDRSSAPFRSVRKMMILK